MSTFLKRFGFGAALLLGLLAGPPSAQAQFAYGQTPYGLNLNNPYVAQQQYLYNTALGGTLANLQNARDVRLALAYSRFNRPPLFPLHNSPYAMGFNPYAAAAGLPAYNPYAALTNPYAALSPGGLTNPYTAGLGSNPYTPGLDAAGLSNPYSPGGIGTGTTLMGTADVLRSYGNVVTSMEQARLLREQWNQSQLETRKKKFELDMFIKANTPTFSEEQAKIAQQTLKRIQSTSSPAEVSSGKSLNYLLDDARKYPGKAPASAEIPLSESVLKRLNVSAGNRSLGVLRNDGNIDWPTALERLTTKNQREELERRAKNLVSGAYEGKRDANALKDLRTEVEQIRDQLLAKANDIPTEQYLEAKRFLNELDDSRMAIESGEAPVQREYQKMVESGKISNIRDLVNVMAERGWRFAPALSTDEAAYRALYSALVAYDVALNSQVAMANSGGNEKKE